MTRWPLPVTHKIFIDGAAGTTGLEIAERLEGRSEFVLLRLDDAQRKAEAGAGALCAKPRGESADPKAVPGVIGGLGCRVCRLRGMRIGARAWGNARLVITRPSVTVALSSQPPEMFSLKWGAG